MNRLYYGDCLSIMQDMESDSVELIYLDPPFKSDRIYNTIYRDEETGLPLPVQIEVFSDMWTLDGERKRIIGDMPVLMRQAGVNNKALVNLLDALSESQSNDDQETAAYLSYMTERLLPMKRVLKPKGSIYLHCDPTASHYIKVAMDAIFGRDNFQNEIIWKRTSSHNRAKRWGPVHDTILFYSGGQKHTWNRVLEELDPDYVESHYSHEDKKGRFRLSDLTGPGPRDGDTGQPWREVDPNKKNRHWELPPDRALPEWFEYPKGYSDMLARKRLEVLDAQGLIHWPKKKDGVPQFKRYLGAHSGAPVQDIITDIKSVSAQADQNEEYPTQKPVELLERIISVSSNEGDVVFDPFCGCATTIEAAHKLGRKWIGVDIAIHAIKRVAGARLGKLGLVEKKDYEIHGVPNSLEDARDLWERDPYNFQKWAVEQVEGFVTEKRTSDGGVDGELYFRSPSEAKIQTMVIEVKGGDNVNVDVVHRLLGVMQNKKAAMAGLIIRKDIKPRQRANFEREMAAAGVMLLSESKRSIPRMQMLTAQEILEGKRFETPSYPLGRGDRSPGLPGVGV